MQEPKEFKTEHFSGKQLLQRNELMEAVHEFLLKNGYFRSLDSLQEEMMVQDSNVDAYTKNAEQHFRFGQSLLLEVIQIFDLLAFRSRSEGSIFPSLESTSFRIC